MSYGVYDVNIIPQDMKLIAEYYLTYNEKITEASYSIFSLDDSKLKNIYFLFFSFQGLGIRSQTIAAKTQVRTERNKNV